MGIATVRETPSLTGQSVGGTNEIIELTQAHPPVNQHQKGPFYLWVVGKVTDSWLRAKQDALFPL